jgi:hypothetical protein
VNLNKKLAKSEHINKSLKETIKNKSAELDQVEKQLDLKDRRASKLEDRINDLDSEHFEQRKSLQIEIETLQKRIFMIFF